MQLYISCRYCDPPRKKKTILLHTYTVCKYYLLFSLVVGLRNNSAYFTIFILRKTHSPSHLTLIVTFDPDIYLDPDTHNPRSSLYFTFTFVYVFITLTFFFLFFLFSSGQKKKIQFFFFNLEREKDYRGGLQRNHFDSQSQASYHSDHVIRLHIITMRQGAVSDNCLCSRRMLLSVLLAETPDYFYSIIHTRQYQIRFTALHQ